MRLPWIKPKEEKKGLSFIVASDSGGSAGIVYTEASTKEKEGSSVVAACCAWAARNVVKASPAVSKATDNGDEFDFGHPVSKMLAYPQGGITPEKRNKYTGRQLVSSIVVSAMLHGDAYVVKVRNARGGVIGLDYLPYGSVTPVPDPTDARLVLYYEVTGSTGPALRIPVPDMVTFPLFGLDDARPHMGRDPLKSLARQIVTDNKVAQYTDAVMGSPSPRLAVSAKDAGMAPNQDEADVIAEQFNKSHGGRKAGRAVVMTFPADITPFSFSPDDMAISVISNLPESRICAVYGIPPTVLQLQVGLEHSTYSNMQEAREAAVEEFLIPLWRQIEDILTMALLRDIGFDERYSIKFDLSDVKELQDDLDALFVRVQGAFAANLVSRAEAREMIGMEVLPGDEDTWAWMLRPVSTPVGLPGKPADAQKARENGG